MDTQTIKNQTNITDVYHRLYSQPLQNAGSGNYKTFCPHHAETNPSYYLILKPGDHHFHCFSCGAHGDIFDMVMMARGTTFAGALQFFGVERENFERLSREAPPRHIEPPPEWLTPELVNYWHEQLLPPVDESKHGLVLEYLQGRGIYPQVIQDFEIGWSDDFGRLPKRFKRPPLFMQNRIIIPYFSPYDDTVRAVKGRLLRWDDKGYKWRAQGNVGHLPFNWERAFPVMRQHKWGLRECTEDDKRIWRPEPMDEGEEGVLCRPGQEVTFILESEFDAATVSGIIGRYLHGQAAAYWGVISTTAAGFSGQLLDVLAGRRVILLADNDEAGRKLAANLRGQLGGLEVYFVEYGGLKDFGELYGAAPELATEWVIKLYERMDVRLK